MVYDIRKRQIKGAAAKCNFPPLDMGGPLGARAGRVGRGCSVVGNGNGLCGLGALGGLGGR